MWRLALCLMYVSVTVSSCNINVKQAMENENIVPELISKAPEGYLQVLYPSGVKADLGNELTPTQVKDQPSVGWDADPNSFYTLCLTDPDVPDRATPKGKEPFEFQHWLVGNIPGKNVSAGETLSAYVGSGPPPNTGLHRYVFLTYKQPDKLTFDEPRISNKTAEKRTNFSIEDFKMKYNLGTPVAGNFYQAKYDEYVPTLYKQLGV